MTRELERHLERIASAENDRELITLMADVKEAEQKLHEYVENLNLLFYVEEDVQEMT
jgi:hypothetical protein